MTAHSYRDILQAVRDGILPVEEALKSLTEAPIEELGFATIDHERRARKGFAEVVYCEGKTIEQSVVILERLIVKGGNVLGTRADREVFERLAEKVDGVKYDELARTVYVQRDDAVVGNILVLAAGTSDLPVAQEAAITASLMGNRVDKVYDVGVAGLHRLLRQLNRMQQAKVIIAVAGMEGALVSVVAGLVDVPVIGVPTSVGYGAQLQGLAPLLGMLTSCAPGVSVVNIDNGFGAGYLASMINHMGEH